MMKYYIILAWVCVSGSTIYAQNVEDGKQLLRNNRNASALELFKKITADNSRNIVAFYWLGQTHLALNDTIAAKKMYTNVASDNDMPPIIEAGLGHIELLYGRKMEATVHFDNAIKNSIKKRKEDPAVLAAVGRANADGAMEIGDVDYSVEKLKRAIQLDPQNPENYINLGIMYLKKGSEFGGEAYKSFNNALEINPTYALAKYRLAKIFQSQNNVEKYIGYYVGAVEADSTFAPAYLELYNYYSLRDVNKARTYLEHYIANSDKDCNVSFFYADYLFRSGSYQESLDKALAMKDGECKNYERLPLLMAYNYDRLEDSANAQNHISLFITKTAVNKITKDDYLFAASVFKKAVGGELTAINYLKTALEQDTIPANRYVYMDTIANLYRKLNQWDTRLEWLQKSFATNPKPSNFDVYNLGDGAFLAQNYMLADSMFTRYKNEYPGEVYGYLGLAKSAVAQDKDTTTGSAVSAIQDYIAYLEKTDKEKYKTRIFQNYAYLVYVHANVLKDLPAALQDLNGILAIDPDNAYAKQTSAQIQRILNTQPQKKTSSEIQKKPVPKNVGEDKKEGSTK